MREDTLGQILMYANIYATSQALVLDTCMGLVLGAIAERQDGNGRILAPYIGQNPCVDILRRFNFGTMCEVCSLLTPFFKSLCRRPQILGVNSLLSIRRICAFRRGTLSINYIYDNSHPNVICAGSVKTISPRQSCPSPN